MTAQSLPSRRHNRAQSNRQCFAAVYLMAVALLLGPIMMPVPANADVVTDTFSSKTARLLICVLTWGQECYLSEEVIGTGEPVSPVPVTCERPLMTGLPQFLTWPKGQARYRFQENCFSAAKPGSVMTVRWEGSWNPSETKADRPNASETVEITGFEPFLPGRASGGKIYLYWTARCSRDPWLQSGGCTPWGAYVPEDLRAALPDIDRQSFPRTGNVIAPADRRRLYAEYLRVNPRYFGGARSRQGTYFTAPPIAVEKPKISTEQLLASPQESMRDRMSEAVNQQAQAVTPPSNPPATPFQTKPSNFSIFSRGVESDSGGLEEIEPAEAPLAITIDRQLHVRSMEGEDIVLEPGTYEVETVLDLQLSLAKEGQPSILLPATRDQHQESLDHPVALLVPGQSDQRHLVFLRPDGLRLDVIGSTTGIQSRGPGMIAPRPSAQIREAMAAATPDISGLPSPPCRPNPNPFGPRWIPIPCTMPAPAPPYLDGTNMLHACVNNHTGAFRIVRAAEACVADLNEVKVKWQLTPLTP